MSRQCPKCKSADIYEADFIDEKIKCQNCRDGYLEFREYNDFIPTEEGDKAAIYTCDACLKDFITTIKIDNEEV